MHRRLAALALAALCASAPGPAAARASSTEAGHLRIGVTRDVDTIFPLLSNQSAVTDIAQLIFSGLIRYDDEGRPIPDAALTVPSRVNHGISDDGRTITYHLRPDVKFSDGTPLTADDVVFTWQQIVEPANNVPQRFPYDLAASVRAADPHTVVVRLRAPNAAFVAFFMRCGTQGSILPAHLLRGKADLNHDPYALRPVGSGPFVVTRYEPGSVIEFSRNDAYFGPRPKLERISWKIIPNDASLLVALRSHGIDLLWGAPEQAYRELKAVPGVTVSARVNATQEQLAFNTRRAPFDDVRVRHAVAAAIDWESLQKRVYLDVDAPGIGDVFPGSWAFDRNVRGDAHDLARARHLLDEAGWTPGPDGVRVRAGKRLTIALRTVAGILPRQNAEVVIQQALRDVGIEVEVRNAPASLLFAPLAGGGLLAKGDFDLAIYGWTSLPDPDDTQTLGPDRVPPNGANYSGLRDAEIGRLQRAALAVYERERRAPIYARLQRRVAEVLPFRTIVWRANIDAFSDDLHGFRPGVIVSDFWNPWEWEI